MPRYFCTSFDSSRPALASAVLPRRVGARSSCSMDTADGHALRGGCSWSPGHLQACLIVHCLTPGCGPPLGACLLHRVLRGALSTWARAAWTLEEWPFRGWTYVEPVDICFSLLPPRSSIQRLSSFRKLQGLYLLCKALPWIFLLSSAPWDCTPL